MILFNIGVICKHFMLLFVMSVIRLFPALFLVSTYFVYISLCVTCGTFKFRKVELTVDAFDAKLRHTLKSANLDRWECAVLCHEEPRCLWMSVCPKVCHLLGELPVDNSSIPEPDYRTCKIYIIVSVSFHFISFRFISFHFISFRFIWFCFIWFHFFQGAKCSSVIRAFAHGAMGRRINPSWGEPIELFFVPTSVPRLV